jgi:hypothetical protein
MFVRKKTTKSGTVKHYLVESHREGGKVRQKVLHYLGEHPTVGERLAWLDAEVDRDCLSAIELMDALMADGQNHQIRQMLRVYDYDITRHKAEADRLRQIIRSAQEVT